jgi:hypothetical protein
MLFLLFRMATVDGGISHSTLVEKVPKTVSADPAFNELLGEVTTFREPKGRRQGLYEMRRDQWKEFDPFWARFRQSDLVCRMHELGFNLIDLSICVVIVCLQVRVHLPGG